MSVNVGSSSTSASPGNRGTCRMRGRTSSRGRRRAMKSPFSAGEAACPAPGGSKEQLGPAQLALAERTIVAGQEPVERRVPGNYGAQKGRRRPKDSLIVDQDI